MPAMPPADTRPLRNVIRDGNQCLEQHIRYRIQGWVLLFYAHHMRFGLSLIPNNVEPPAIDIIVELANQTCVADHDEKAGNGHG